MKFLSGQAHRHTNDVISVPLHGVRRVGLQVPCDPHKRRPANSGLSITVAWAARRHWIDWM